MTPNRTGLAPADALRTYRLTRISAFGLTTRIRVVQRTDRWQIATSLSFRRNDDTEKVIWQRTRALTDAETVRLEQLVRASSFWTLPVSNLDPQRLVLDGIDWVLEGTHDGQSYTIWRDDRTERPFADLCAYLVALSGVDDLRPSLWHRLRSALREALRKRKMHADHRRRRRATDRSNRQAARLAARMAEHGLTCPHCGTRSHDARYVDKRPDACSYFICRSCGRSCHPE